MSGPEDKASGGLTPGLKMDLLHEGHSFSFFQAIRLLRMMLFEYGGDVQADRPDGHSIRIRPNLSLAFPPADIAQIKEIDAGGHEEYAITANFLGLYGSASPLPTFYTEDLMNEAAEDESVSKDFIDIFNQRMFELFYDVCAKYRLPFQIFETNSHAHLERLFCLLGMGEKPLQEAVADPYQLLRYIGLITQKPCSGLGLELILRDALDGLPVTVVPCVARKAKIPHDQRAFLGSSKHALGVNMTIGEEVSDRMGKFKIRIGPLDKPTFQSFYPGAENYSLTCFLTDFYILERLEYDIEVILAEGEARTVCLGDPERSRIGLNTWIFSSDRIGEMRKVYSPAA